MKTERVKVLTGRKLLEHLREPKKCFIGMRVVYGGREDIVVLGDDYIVTTVKEFNRALAEGKIIEVGNHFYRSSK